jgi:hypothetical protein
MAERTLNTFYAIVKSEVFLPAGGDKKKFV